MNQLLTSVVREICTLRSVGAGERATAPGHPVAISDGRPYRDRRIMARVGKQTYTKNQCFLP